MSDDENAHLRFARELLSAVGELRAALADMPSGAEHRLQRDLSSAFATRSADLAARIRTALQRARDSERAAELERGGGASQFAGEVSVRAER